MLRERKRNWGKLFYSIPYSVVLCDGDVSQWACVTVCVVYHWKPVIHWMCIIQWQTNMIYVYGLVVTLKGGSCVNSCKALGGWCFILRLLCMYWQTNYYYCIGGRGKNKNMCGLANNCVFNHYVWTNKPWYGRQEAVPGRWVMMTIMTWREAEEGGECGRANWQQTNKLSIIPTIICLYIGYLETPAETWRKAGRLLDDDRMPISYISQPYYKMMSSQSLVWKEWKAQRREHGWKHMCWRRAARHHYLQCPLLFNLLHGSLVWRV